jgi:hypothetical protein
MCGACFSSYWSVENVNARKLKAAQDKVERLTDKTDKKCGPCSIPDCGSNAGTKMYKLWALIWEMI